MKHEYRSGMERIVNQSEPEYAKFEFVAKALEIESPNNAHYVVRDVYLDYGARWVWTTIIRWGYKNCQVLNPREWLMIMNSENVTELIEAVNEIRNGEWFGDKVKDEAHTW